MADKPVVVAVDPNKARLIALKNKPVLTAQEVKEAIELLTRAQLPPHIERNAPLPEPEITKNNSTGT